MSVTFGSPPAASATTWGSGDGLPGSVRAPSGATGAIEGGGAVLCAGAGWTTSADLGGVPAHADSVSPHTSAASRFQRPLRFGRTWSLFQIVVIAEELTSMSSNHNML